MAKKKKVLNIATAEVADGALPSARSVYEMCGISTAAYREKTVEQYRARLDKMDLIQLQDEAYAAGVAAGVPRNILILKLEQKFIREITKNKFVDPGIRPENPEYSDIVEKAKQIVGAGSNRV